MPYSTREQFLLEQIERLRDGMWIVGFVSFVCGILVALLACQLIAG